MPTNARWSPRRRLSEEDEIRWNKLIAVQHGAASLAQLREFGVTGHAIAANVDADRWQRALPGVIVVFTGPLPRATRLAAAVLYGGPCSVLSHHTAAQEWGLVADDEDEPIHVTVPYGRSAVSHLPQVMVHRSRAFHHIATATEPPRTSREDTILDVAVAEPTAEQARNTLVHLVGSTRIALWRMHKQLEWRPPRRYRKAIKAGLDLVAGGAVSALEAEYVLNVEREHGLPAGRRQVPFGVDGVVLWEDVTYDDAGAALTVRLDGRRFHATSRVAFRDRRRDNAAELSGRARLVYGWHEVHENPCAVAGEVMRVLRREGWGGSGQRCPRCR